MMRLLIFSILASITILSSRAQNPERVDFDWAYWDEINNTPQKGYIEIEKSDGTPTYLSIIFNNDTDEDTRVYVKRGVDYKARLNVTTLRKQEFGPCYYLPLESAVELPEFGLDRFWIKLDKKKKNDVTTVHVEKRQSGRLMGRPKVIMTKADDVMNLISQAVVVLNLNLRN